MCGDWEDECEFLNGNFLPIVGRPECGHGPQSRAELRTVGELSERGRAHSKVGITHGTGPRRSPPFLSPVQW
jgi:hypothetical protein